MGGDGAAADGTELAAAWIELAVEGTELAVEVTELVAEGTELVAEGTELVAARKEGGVPSGPGITRGCRCTCRAEMTTASRWWYLQSARQAAGGGRVRSGAGREQAPGGSALAV